MTSGCLDRKEVRGAIWGVLRTGQPVETQDVFFWRLAGRSAPTGLANCPLDRVLTYKNLIYLLNLQFPATFGGFLNFCVKCKSAFILEMVRDREISTKFLTPRLYAEYTGDFSQESLSCHF